MLAFIIDALSSFRHTFSRNDTHFYFIVVVLAFIGATQIDGVTSMCRFWGVAELQYRSLLGFFHSDAWSLTALLHCWTSFVLTKKIALTCKGRTILLGDHTNLPKDARQMPAVVNIHQNSETQSKPGFFRGHFWGAIGLLIGSPVLTFCLPLLARIQQGWAHRLEIPSKEDTLQRRMVLMAIAIASSHKLPSYLVLDAFFAVGPVFQLARSVLIEGTQEPLVHIITRAKAGYVAYYPPPEPIGAPKEDFHDLGKRLKLDEAFERLASQFTTVTATLYGRIEEISLLHLDLKWPPAGTYLRFVFSRSSRGDIILMSSDLTLEPLEILTLYSYRIRIETMFDALKNVLGAFKYHFWTFHLPKHTRQAGKIKNDSLLPPQKEHLKAVISCWESCECFVQLGCIALGLLQLVSLCFTTDVWNHYRSYLRTRSREIPSERTVKEVLSKEIILAAEKVPADGTFWSSLRKWRKKRR